MLCCSHPFPLKNELDSMEQGCTSLRGVLSRASDICNPTWASDWPDASVGILEGALRASALQSPRARQRAALLLSRIMGSTAQRAAHPSRQAPAQSSSNLHSCSLKAPSLEHASMVCGSTCSRHT